MDVGAADVVFELATLEAFVVVVSVVLTFVLVAADLVVLVAVEDEPVEPLLLRSNKLVIVISSN